MFFLFLKTGSGTPGDSINVTKIEQLKAQVRRTRNHSISVNKPRYSA